MAVKLKISSLGRRKNGKRSPTAMKQKDSECLGWLDIRSVDRDKEPYEQTLPDQPHLLKN